MRLPYENLTLSQQLRAMLLALAQGFNPFRTETYFVIICYDADGSERIVVRPRSPEEEQP